MSLLSLLVKSSIGIGIVGATTAISLSTINNGGNQYPFSAHAQNTSAEIADGVGASSSSANKEKVLAEIAERKCEEAYDFSKGGGLGALYVCPFSSEGERMTNRDRLSGEVGELWYLVDDINIENFGVGEDISAIFKKVVSITYKEATEQVAFELEGSDEEKHFGVKTGESWQYHGTRAYFTEMDTLLSSIYKVS